jgi:5S rRNA maturation endonuclease (ribonuclease M5)
VKTRQSIADRRRTSAKAQSHKELCFRHADLSREMPVFSLDADRADRLREVLQALYEVNKRVPVIVEGRRDVNALRKIGLVGDIITLHSGKGLYEFCEDISERFNRVILLLDWDDKGEKLFRSLSEGLAGLWEEFSPIREVLKVLCQKDIKDIEGIPGLMERLAGTGVTVGEQEA